MRAEYVSSAAGRTHRWPTQDEGRAWFIRSGSAAPAASSGPDAIRMSRTPLVDADHEEVRERIDLCGGHIRIGREVVGGVEIGRRVAALAPAVRVVVIERV